AAGGRVNRGASAGPGYGPAAPPAYRAAGGGRPDAIRVRARRAGRIAALTHPLATAVRDLAVRATPAGAAYRAMDALFDGFVLPDGMHTVPGGVGARW
ncbi:hypothetical protein ACFVZ8_29940, partial [Streptomyces sp. NPDC059558]